MAISVRAAAPIERVRVDAFTVPTDFPEADGTISWDRTSLVLVHLSAGGTTGLGYSYTDPSAGRIVETVLADAIRGEDALSIGARWLAMSRVVRNLGRPGLVATAISAVDNALWDLKARILDVSLADLVGRARDAVPIYGSGGFTSYPIDRLQKQLGDWAAAGIGMVKMKVGTDPGADVERVTAAREAIGPDAQLFVDANGAYSRKQALAFADRYAELGVAWFEEPVSSDDLEGLRLIRDRAPAGMDIAAGEYGYTPDYFERMLAAGAVDCLQADATRCLGITGWLQANALCEARSMPLSAHCAPSIHAHPAACATRLRHIEYFHDHVRIERMLFDGVLEPNSGALWPDRTRPGNGLVLKETDAERWRIDPSRPSWLSWAQAPAGSEARRGSRPASVLARAVLCAVTPSSMLRSCEFESNMPWAPGSPGIGCQTSLGRSGSSRLSVC